MKYHNRLTMFARAWALFTTLYVGPPLPSPIIGPCLFYVSQPQIIPQAELPTMEGGPIRIPTSILNWVLSARADCRSNSLQHNDRKGDPGSALFAHCVLANSSKTRQIRENQKTTRKHKHKSKKTQQTTEKHTHTIGHVLEHSSC